jgi:hypothetical protein
MGHHAVTPSFPPWYFCWDSRRFCGFVSFPLGCIASRNTDASCSVSKLPLAPTLLPPAFSVFWVLCCIQPFDLEYYTVSKWSIFSSTPPCYVCSCPYSGEQWAEWARRNAKSGRIVESRGEIVDAHDWKGFPALGSLSQVNLSGYSALLDAHLSWYSSETNVIVNDQNVELSVISLSSYWHCMSFVT